MIPSILLAPSGLTPEIFLKDLPYLAFMSCSSSNVQHSLTKRQYDLNSLGQSQFNTDQKSCGLSSAGVPDKPVLYLVSRALSALVACALRFLTLWTSSAMMWNHLMSF